MGSGPREFGLASEAALAALADVVPASSVTGSLADWAGAVGSLQRVIDAASAAQDAAIVRLAAIEPELLEDGTVVESHRALGHVALDAPAIVSGVLAASAVHAERRVRAAVRLAGDGPVGSDAHTGLGALHEAMRTGRLDAYRAGVLAEELDAAPAEVRATIVDALEAHFATEDAPHLRRRCRRVLALISPDLLRQRAQRARAESELRRWAEEPGVDRWSGTFPSEEAAQAWAAIDALARRYVADAVCATIGRARAKALTDLVSGNATVETVLSVTVPAAALDLTSGRTPPGADADTGTDTDARIGADARIDTDARIDADAGTDAGDLVEVTGSGAGDPVLVSREWLESALKEQGPVDLASCHPLTGAHLGEHADSRPVPGAQDEPDRQDGESEHESEDRAHDREDGETAGHGDTRLKDLDPVRSAAAVSGADRYRPSRRLAKLVRARDRRCRFPGCAVAAVFCDVDHVRPWPIGPTSTANLMCLCRRHHRVKQRHGWRVVLTPDGIATWTDPTGRVRTTEPVDALHTTVLRAPLDPPTPAAASSTSSRARTVLPDGPHSALEFLLEHLGATPPAPAPGWRDHHGRHHPELLPQPTNIMVDLNTHCPRHRPRPTGRRHGTDPPPF